MLVWPKVQEKQKQCIMLKLVFWINSGFYFILFYFTQSVTVELVFRLCLFFVSLFRVCQAWLSVWRSSPERSHAASPSLPSITPPKRGGAKSLPFTRLTSCKGISCFSVYFQFLALVIAKWLHSIQLIWFASVFFNWGIFDLFSLLITGNWAMACSYRAALRWHSCTPKSNMKI